MLQLELEALQSGDDDVEEKASEVPTNNLSPKPKPAEEKKLITAPLAPKVRHFLQLDELN